MNKENNKSAAGLRRSAIAERIRLREEWSALKGTDDVQPIANVRDKRRNVLRNAMDNVRADKKNIVTGSKLRPKTGVDIPKIARPIPATTDVLRGIVSLVEVGAESRALPLRAALTALGATVVPAFSPLVTHLVWSQGGCRSTRTRARALACQLVSPLWVEACAAAGRRLPEATFPAAARASDLPSPRTLRRLLYKAEMENIPLADLLSDSREREAETKPRLRISSETERDTSTATDTSANTSADTSHERSHDKTDIENRVNTAPRRALPASHDPLLPAKSRRKLFTQKEPDLSKSSPNESDEDRTPLRPKLLTQRERRDLAHAERMARRVLNAGSRPNAHTHRHANAPADTRAYRIVLTGMSRSERVAAYQAIRTLNGRIQKDVNRKTTHVLLGSCHEDSPDNSREKLNKTSSSTNNITNKSNISKRICIDKLIDDENVTYNKTSASINNITNKNNLSIKITIKKSTGDKNVTKNSMHTINEETEAQKSNMATLESLASKLNMRSPSEKRKLSMTSTPKKNKTDISGIKNLIEISDATSIHKSNMASALAGKTNMAAAELTAVKSKMASRKERTLNALLGAARGCRVLFGDWAKACVEEGRWIHHCGFEVPHLRKLSQRARIERNALGKTRSEYAYDVFNGTRVRVSQYAEQRDAAIQLLKLCGAVIVRDDQDGGQQQDGGRPQNGGRIQHGNKTHNTIDHGNGGWTQNGRFLNRNGRFCQRDCVIAIGIEDGEVNSKWVFDSVASARIRTARRYVNKSIQETSTFCE